MAVIELTEKNFEETISGNDFIIVDYWAPWCGPCRSFAPTFEKVSEDFEEIIFAKVNTEAEQELAGHFSIRSIPTLMIFRENIIIYSSPGALAEGQLRELIKKVSELDMEEVKAQVEKQNTKVPPGQVGIEIPKKKES